MRFSPLPTDGGRDPQRGATLLETLIAAALVAMVAIFAFNVMARSTKGQADRLQRLWLAEFARSVAEEYVVSYPAMPREGASGGWAWAISEARVDPDRLGSETVDIEYFEIGVRTWAVSRPNSSYATTTLMARRLR